ncbi:hypothetical protein LQ327_18065 [Actinomycetospora endophytica]|uniref:DUF222 domain-containing protein n=1 Tax=Actinomycetospora endophytica TaxID=2291215 RepID=A0ABS8PAG4_9PSEU|nr:hypothetical protein [Actinomycetospora endophytica]MCD2195278.1 hypothetical protein [Actinomycetospora endophytica]
MIEQSGQGDLTATAPDGLPVLSAGRHHGPRQGSCVMEYVSVLAGEPWSDRPRCTDRALAELARRVNDGVRPAVRPELAGLAPRLVGAVGPEKATDVVAGAIARVGLEDNPGDLGLTRVHRGARARLARAGGPGGRLWRAMVRCERVASHAGVGDAYAQFERTMAGRPRAERDAVRVRALAAAVEDVRRHVEAPEERPVPSWPAGRDRPRASAG